MPPCYSDVRLIGVMGMGNVVYGIFFRYSKFNANHVYTYPHNTVCNRAFGGCLLITFPWRTQSQSTSVLRGGLRWKGKEIHIHSVDLYVLFFHVTFCRVKQVLRLEVPVRDAHVVQVLDSHADVFHELGGLTLVEGLLLLNALEQLATKHAINRINDPLEQPLHYEE